MSWFSTSRAHNTGLSKYQKEMRKPNWSPENESKRAMIVTSSDIDSFESESEGEEIADLCLICLVSNCP